MKMNDLRRLLATKISVDTRAATVRESCTDFVCHLILSWSTCYSMARITMTVDKISASLCILWLWTLFCLQNGLSILEPVSHLIWTRY